MGRPSHKGWLLLEPVDPTHALWQQQCCTWLAGFKLEESVRSPEGSRRYQHPDWSVDFHDERNVSESERCAGVLLVCVYARRNA
jgi:hypothetical protein